MAKSGCSFLLGGSVGFRVFRKLYLDGTSLALDACPFASCF